VITLCATESVLAAKKAWQISSPTLSIEDPIQETIPVSPHDTALGCAVMNDFSNTKVLHRRQQASKI
jgi:hypothetical protein